MRGAPAAVVACTPEDYRWGAQDCLHAPLRRAMAVPEGYIVHGVLMLGERRDTYRWVPPRKPLSAQWL